ncbi:MULTISPECIES: TIGR02594 family protein [unclassified Rhizobium]|uniref:TIGR02594 family protein n=1 Tax=unclassified Rhizobium TaxID=2613769 RepID=UPI001C83D29C|nr:MULTISPECIES: TIGR02594 family protein [unclassified Rhizobium]MBX5212979.1 TIGR02594 family protein [Rhizobium sp. NLR9a]MBX5243248.1 TIGR02594 family protein [Rhizobium sp. NLR3b]MBX5274824.1 TIGR02594 family protein [Rhizobium sp. NLR13a]MBX5280931.1 TIGR02594 family protein [Rhizobium sp. NLR10a]MBX5292365.1 TIGR02594 family protein [Rhizobium sp. NLR15a]
MRIILVIALTVFAAPCEADMLVTASKYDRMHERSISFLGINPRRTSWCGAFLAFVAKRSSRQPPANPNMAVSWKSFGKPVFFRSAKRGDVVVIRSGRRFHVSLFDHFDQRRQYVYLFGGNQSNRVQLSRYRASSVVAVRR